MRISDWSSDVCSSDLVVRATVKGNLVVAIIQGSLGGLIFWILGVGAPLLWGVIMIVLSMIPVVGAGLIWGPVAIYLFATGDWVQGSILTAFGIGIIGLEIGRASCREGVCQYV